jgi:hypothetical protein
MGFMRRRALIPRAGMVALGCGSSAATTYPNAILQARPPTAPGTCCRGVDSEGARSQATLVGGRAGPRAGPADGPNDGHRAARSP